MHTKPIFRRGVELAPDHKTGLSINTPVMTSAGCWGFADEYANLLDFSQLGAFITNPITLHPRQPSYSLQTVPIPAGTLVHTGMPNPGMRGTLRKYIHKWRRAPCPIIVHLAPSDCHEVEECLEQLERVESVVAVELGFPDNSHPDDVAAMITAASSGLLPIMTRAPFMRAAEFARISELAGAQALTVAAPPRGMVRKQNGRGWISGRLYGTFVFPLVLQIVRQISGKTKLPIIASGGIHTRDQALAFLNNGASAIQLDSLVWTDPLTVMQIVAELAD